MNIAEIETLLPLGQPHSVEMPEHSARGKTRRRFLTASGAAGALALAGCIETGSDDDGSDDGGTTDDTGEDVESIDFVLNPAEETLDIEVQYSPLIRSLEDEFDVEIEPTVAETYNATVEELARAGEGDKMLADTSPVAVLELGDDVSVCGMRIQFGAAQYFSTLVTRADSEYESVDDLAGETVVGGSLGSISGGIAALWMLQENGLDLGNAVDGGSAEDFEWIGDQAHDIAVGQLLEDESIAAAGAGGFATIPNIPADEIEENFPEVAEISAEFAGAGSESTDLRLLDASPPLPRAPIVANAEWDDDLRQEIDEFLVNADEDVLGHDAHQLAEDLALDIDDEVLDAYEEDDDFDIGDWDVDEDDWQEFDDHLLWFTGIEEADSSAYDPIADFASDLGIDYDDL